MNLQDAGSYAQLMDTRDRVGSDTSIPFYERAQELAPISQQLFSPEDSGKTKTFGDILSVAIGAALGFGAARGASSVLGLSDSAADALAVTGASLGGLVGLSKTGAAEEAFRAGYIKAAIEKGYFKSAFIGSLLLAPLTGLSNAAQRVGTSTGSIIGAADAPDDTDTNIVQTKVETELLRQELERVKAVRQVKALKDVLAKRRALS